MLSLQEMCINKLRDHRVDWEPKPLPQHVKDALSLRIVNKRNSKGYFNYKSRRRHGPFEFVWNGVKVWGYYKHGKEMYREISRENGVRGWKKRTNYYFERIYDDGSIDHVSNFNGVMKCTTYLGNIKTCRHNYTTGRGWLKKDGTLYIYRPNNVIFVVMNNGCIMRYTLGNNYDLINVLCSRIGTPPVILNMHGIVNGYLLHPPFLYVPETLTKTIRT